MTEVAYMVFGMEQTPMLVLPEPLLDSYHPTAEQARVLTALAAGNSVGVLLPELAPISC